ncbi:MAG: DUF87 domain-containing protein, partial [Anaerolineae bacterium]|nr:DUF87 domain-containing protein [Anaerolineae bacterium]
MSRVYLDRQHRVKLSILAQRGAVKNLKHIPADANGRIGAVARPDGTILFVDAGRLLDEHWAIARSDPERERADALQRLVLSMRGVAGSQAENLLEMPEQEMLPVLPTQISIQEVLGTQTPTLDSLVLGVTLGEDGQVIPIRKSLYQLMHLLAIGITGSGKSTWLLAFLAQIQMCSENVEVILIDVHGSAFNIASDWSKLRYPIARNNDEAK